MNKIQSEKYSVYQQILLFIANYLKILNGIARLATEIPLFQTSVKSIDDITAQIQPKASKPKTEDKKNARKAMVTLIVAKAKLIYVWAKDNNNTQLMKDFNLTAASFKGAASKAYQVASYTYSVIDTHKKDITTNTTVTDADIAAILAAINLFHSMFATPSAAITTQKTIKSLYPAAFKAADNNLDNIKSLILGNFEVGANTNPKLVTDFNNALEKPDNVLHTILSVLCLDPNKNPLQDATITIVELNKSTTSNILGIAEITKIKAGTYHVTFEANGYITQSKILTFHPGKKLDITINFTQ